MEIKKGMRFTHKGWTRKNPETGVWDVPVPMVVTSVQRSKIHGLVTVFYADEQVPSSRSQLPLDRFEAQAVGEWL